MKKYLRYLPALLWMGLIFTLSSIPNLQLEGEFSTYDLLLRKVAHVVEYTILLLLLYWGTTSHQTHKRSLIISLLVTILYAASDEIHQSFVPTRDGQLLDVSIDTFGALLGTGLIQYWHAKKDAEH